MQYYTTSANWYVIWKMWSELTILTFSKITAPKAKHLLLVYMEQLLESFLYVHGTYADSEFNRIDTRQRYAPLTYDFSLWQWFPPKSALIPTTHTRDLFNTKHAGRSRRRTKDFFIDFFQKWKILEFHHYIHDKLGFTIINEFKLVKTPLALVHWFVK